MTNKPNRDILLQIMLKNGLSRDDISTMLNRNASTVRHWFSGSENDMPDDALWRLRAMLEEKDREESIKDIEYLKQLSDKLSLQLDRAPTMSQFWTRSNFNKARIEHLQSVQKIQATIIAVQDRIIG